MTDNNIKAATLLAPDLNHALELRGERLLASADLAGEVASMAPLEAYYMVREIGLGQALPILLQLSEEQIEACVDLDCWNRNDFAADSLDEWLSAFALAGPDILAKSFLSLNYVVQLLFLAQTVTVYDPDTDQVPAEDSENPAPRAMTPDGFYLLELKPEMELKIHPFSLLDALYMHDSSAAHQLLSEVRVDLQAQIEEEALRLRNNRMMDIGFMPPDEAAILFSRPASQPLSRPQKPLDSDLSGVPAVYADPFIETTILQSALALITDQEFLSRLEQEIVWVINSAIISYGEKTKDTKLITDIAGRVRDTISLGLESLLAQQETGCQFDSSTAAVRASDLLEVWCINDLFRHGFAATIELQREAKKALEDPAFIAWHTLPATEHADDSADRLARAFFTALLGRHPLQSGYDLAHDEDRKAFACLADIEAAHDRLKMLVAQICHSSYPSTS